MREIDDEPFRHGDADADRDVFQFSDLERIPHKHDEHLDAHSEDGDCTGHVSLLLFGESLKHTNLQNIKDFVKSTRLAVTGYFYS